MQIPVKGVTTMRAMKLKKFVEQVKAKRDKVLSLSVTYYDKALVWRPECGSIIWDSGMSVGKLHPDWTVEEALSKVEGGKARVIFSDEGEIVLRLRP
jgi:hypothetical protein